MRVKSFRKRTGLWNYASIATNGERILWLECIPGLVQCAKHAIGDHPLIQRRFHGAKLCLHQLYVRASAQGKEIESETDLVRVDAANSLHITNLNLSWRNELAHSNSLPAKFGPKNSVKTCDQRP